MSIIIRSKKIISFALFILLFSAIFLNSTLVVAESDNSDDAYYYCVSTLCEPLRNGPVSCTSGTCPSDPNGRSWDEVNNDNKYNQCIQDCITKTTSKATPSTSDSPSSDAALTWTPNVSIGGFTQEQPVTISADRNILGEYISIWYKFLVGIAGLLATIMVIMGGVTWLTSGGSSAIIGDAKKTISSALIGLTLALLSYVLLQVINPNLTTINMPTTMGNITYQGDYKLPTGEYATGSYLSGSDNTGSATCNSNSNGNSTTPDRPYNLSKYATLCGYPEMVYSTADKAGNITTAEQADAYIDSHKMGTGKSPVTGEMVMNTSRQFGVPANILLSVMQLESHFATDPNGTRAIQNFNPGNVGNDDEGNNLNQGSWQAGVNAIGAWISKHPN